MIEDSSTMSKSHRKYRGFGHDVGEPSKRERIRTRCQRAAKKIWDPGMMPKSYQKERVSGHDARELPKRKMIK